MTTYNTGNTIPSVDVRDLYDNAENLDNFSNGQAVTYDDRLGVSRKSLAGMRTDFSAFLAASGFETTVLTYTDGVPLQVDRPTQLLERASDPGTLYSIKLPSTFPVVLSGTWATDEALLVVRVDQALRQDLADDTNPLLGAAIIGRSSQAVGSIAALRLLDKTAVSKHAFATGYYAQGDGGGGAYYLDAADTTSADNGGTIIVAADGGRWKLEYSGSVSVLQFGVKRGTDSSAPALAANNAALLSCRNFVYDASAREDRTELTFPAGIYSYSVSPDWGIRFAKIIAHGEARLRYFGTGNAVIITDSLLEGVSDMHMGRFIVEAPATALNGVYVQSIHHSTLDFNVRGAGSASAGMLVEFAVCTEFPNLTVSNNFHVIGGGQGWYLNAKPLYGLYLDDRNANEAVTACTFVNPVLEGTGIGAYLKTATGNTFIGGTMEGCTDKGIYCDALAISNVLYNVDFEENTNHDIYCIGNTNEFHQCQTMTLVAFDLTANGNTLAGGIHDQIALTAATVRNWVRDLTYNRFSDGSVTNILDTSTRQNYIRRNINSLTGRATNGDEAAFPVTVGATPFTYTNTSNQPMLACWGGGTVSSGSLKRGTAQLVAGGASGNVMLLPQDQLIIDHTATPSLTIFPQ